MIFANFYLFDHPFCIVRARRLLLQAVEDQVVPEERANKSKSLISLLLGAIVLIGMKYEL